MIEAKAKSLLAAYGLSPDNWRQFTTHQDATGDFLIGQHANFAFVGNVTDLRKLATFVNPGHATGFPRGLLLITLNQITGKNSVEIPATNGLLTDPMLASALADIQVYWSHADRTSLCDFIRARVRAASGQRPADIVAQVLPMVRIVGPLRVDIMHTLKRVTKAGDRCTLNVRVQNVPTLIRVDKAFPSRRFTGFTRWGPGDAVDGSPATNLSNHFKKHVCNASGEYAVDARWWWRALEIKVSESDLEGAAASPAEKAFFRGDGSLNPARLDAFIEQVVRVRPGLIDKLYLHYGSAYADYAIKLSKELSGVIVEANAEKVMISGYTGHVTIFGRYDDQDDPASELGISSCYFVERDQRNAKITLNKPNKLWEMKI
jgi:hypothetical protein